MSFKGCLVAISVIFVFVLSYILFFIALCTSVFSLYTCGIIDAAVSIIFVGVSIIFNIIILLFDLIMNLIEGCHAFMMKCSRLT